MIKRTTNKNIKKDIFMFLLSLGIFGFGLIIFWVSTFKIPDLKSFNERVVSQSTKIYDRTGKILLYDVHKNVKRTIVPYADISRYVKNATVAIEDSNFYQHHGVEITAFIRAILADIKSGNFGQGGSTITQQVVKNTLLTNQKTISRKIKEWVLAIKLEREMDKKDILTLYLNEVPYGGNIYGIQEAARSFFGKDAKDLDLAESAYLAAIPQAPTFYSPYGNNKNKLDERKNLVLNKMLQNNFITRDEYREAKNEKVIFKTRMESGIKAPHFVIFIKNYLEKKYGKSVLDNGGLKVITTLDYNLQKEGEKIAKKYALSNEKKFNASNMAFVAINVKTGGILAMVGSRDYFDKKINGNFNVITSHRQPGSAFKPFVYATAFNEGYTPDTVVYDLPTEFSIYCNPNKTPILPQYEDRCYHPTNYDHRYRGPITLRDALAQSVNIPAIKILYLSGLQKSLNTAEALGIHSLTNINQYGLTLVLGGGEVSPLDITSAYSVFANNGIRNPYTGILKIEDGKGKVIEKYESKSTRVLPEKSASYISDILSDNTARAPAFGTRSPLYFDGKSVAAKTGTTNDYRDAWTVGYTSSVAVGAWAGNDDNTSMEKKVAGYIIAPAWHAFMEDVLKSYPSTKFKKPDYNYPTSLKPILKGMWRGNKVYFIDKISGKLATQYTPKELREEKVVPNYHSILYWVNKKDPLGQPPTNPKNDPQYTHWEYSVANWIKKQNFASTSIPTQKDDVHTPELKPQLKIMYPKPNQIYDPTKKINIVISNETASPYPLTKLNYYINNKFIGSSYSTVFSFLPKNISGIQKVNELKIIGFDSVLNRGEVMGSFKLNI